MTSPTHNLLDAPTALLTAAAAAVATGDLATHAELIRQAASQGMPPEALTLPAQIGTMVRARPAAHMLEVADVLTGSSYVQNAKHVCPASQLDHTTDEFLTIMLVSAGAAMAANCEPCMNQVVPNVIEAGGTFDQLQEAVAIGKQVKDRFQAQIAQLSVEAAETALSAAAEPSRAA